MSAGGASLGVADILLDENGETGEFFNGETHDRSSDRAAGECRLFGGKRLDWMGISGAETGEPTGESVSCRREPSAPSAYGRLLTMTGGVEELSCSKVNGSLACASRDCLLFSILAAAYDKRVRR
jgi:hypothetical protein